VNYVQKPFVNLHKTTLLHKFVVFESLLALFYISAIKKLLLWGKLYGKIPNIGLTYVKSP